MSDTPRPARPDANLLAAYLEGELSTDERARVEAAIAADPETHEWVINSMRLVEELEADERAGATSVPVATPAPGPAIAPRSSPARSPQTTQGNVVPFRPRLGIKSGVATLLALAAMLVVALQQPSWWRQLTGGDTSDPRFAALVAAVGDERYIEGRLTGGFRYGPLRSVTRGPGDLSKQNLALLAAAGELQKAAEGSPTADSLHAWGVAQVLLGDYDAAVASLEEAQQLRDTHPQLLSDLAASYLARAAQNDRPDDLPRALAVLERAVRLPDAGPEVFFNQALVLEAVSLPTAALAAWRAALAREDRPEWRRPIEEAIARLERVQSSRERQGQLLERLNRPGSNPEDWKMAASELTSQFPRAAREWVEDVALGAWGRAVTADVGERDSAEASTWQERAAAVALQLGERSNDRSLASLMQAIEGSSGDRRRLLAKGHAELAEGRRLYAALRMSDARPHLEAAARASAGLSPALQVYAEVCLAIVQYYAADIAGARRLLVDLQSRALSVGFHAYHARSLWMLGIIDGAQGRFSGSLHYYQRALAIYEQLGEADYAATMQHLLADGLGTIGQFEPAWRYLRPALGHWHSDWNPRRHYGALMTASVLSRRAGAPEAVLRFLEAATVAAVDWGDPTATVQSRLERARSLVALGLISDARQQIAVARDDLTKIVDPKLRTTFEGQLLRTTAVATSHDDPASAVLALRRAAEIYGTAGSSLQLVEIHLNAVRALRLAGRADQARALALEGIGLIEQQRDAIAQADLRISFVDRVWDLYMEAVDLAIERGDIAAAFEIAERGRARTLSVSAEESSGSLTLADVQRRLRDDELLLYFTQRPQTWVVWAISHSGVTVHQGDTELLVRTAQRLSRAVARRQSAELAAATQDVSRQILSPLDAVLERARRVIVCADGVLFGVPFAALPRPDGRRLVESATVSWVPAARMLTSPTAYPREMRAAVLAPRYSGRGLTPLPAAAAESARIAEIYGVSVVSGSAATAEALKRSLTDADIIHFAGHAVASPSAPVPIQLVVAGNEDMGDVVVTAADLARFGVRSGATIVLAACSSVAANVRRGEGGLSLARPFLAAGAASVVGTLWLVDDATVAPIFVDFHRGLRDGMPADEALANAQRTAIARSGSAGLSDWAAILLVTAVS